MNVLWCQDIWSKNCIFPHDRMGATECIYTFIQALFYVHCIAKRRNKKKNLNVKHDKEKNLIWNLFKKSRKGGRKENEKTLLKWNMQEELQKKENKRNLRAWWEEWIFRDRIYFSNFRSIVDDWNCCNNKWLSIIEI